MPVRDGQRIEPLPIGPITIVRWRPHTEQAPLGTVALIGVEASEGSFLLNDIYELTEIGWCSEETGRPLNLDVYHWLPEHELLAGLMAPT